MTLGCYYNNYFYSKLFEYNKSFRSVRTKYQTE